MARAFFRFARSPPRPGKRDKEGSSFTEDSDVKTSVVASRSSPDLTAIASINLSPKKEGLSRSSSKSKRLAPWRRSIRLQSPPRDASSSSSGQTVKSVAQSDPAIIDVPATTPPQSFAKQIDPHHPDPSPARHDPIFSSTTTTAAATQELLDESFDFIDHPDDIPSIPDPYERPPSRCSSRRSSLQRSPPSQTAALAPSTHSSPRNSLSGLPLVAAAAALTENEMDMHIAAASSLAPDSPDENKVQERSVFEDDDEDQVETEEDELARLRAYARSVRDFMGMFRMHAAELFDDEYYEQHNRLLEAQQRQEKPRKFADEFEDASDAGGEEDMEIDEEEPGNSIIAGPSQPERGQLRRVGGSKRAPRGDYDESDSYDEGFEFEYGQVAEDQDFDFESSFSVQSSLSSLSGVQQRPRGGSVPLHWRFSELEVIDEEEDEEDEVTEAADPSSPANNGGAIAECKDLVREDSALIVTSPMETIPADLTEEVAEFESSSIPFPASQGIPSPVSTPPSSAKTNGPSRPVLTLAMPASPLTPSLTPPAAQTRKSGTAERDSSPSPSPSPNSDSALLTPASTLWQIMTQPRRRRSFAPIPPPKPTNQPSLSPFGQPPREREAQPTVFVVEDTSADDPISPERVVGSLQDILVQMKTEKARLEHLEHYYLTMCSPERVSNEKTVTVRTQIDALARAIRQLELASPISPAPGAPVIGSVPLPGSAPISPISPVRTAVPQPSTPQKLSPSSAAKSSPSKSSSKLSPSASGSGSGLQRSPSKGRTSTLSNLDLPPLSPLITLAHNSPSRVPLPKIITEMDDDVEPKRGLLFGSPVKPQASSSTTRTPLVSPVRSEESSDMQVDDSEDPFVIAVEQSPISPRLTEAFQVSLSESTPSSPGSNYEGDSARMENLDDDDETIMPGRRILSKSSLDLPGRAQIKRRAGSLDLKKSIMVCGA